MVTCAANAPSLICKLNTVWAYLRVSSCKLTGRADWENSSAPSHYRSCHLATTLFDETADMTDFHILNLWQFYLFLNWLSEACFCASPFICPAEKPVVTVTSCGFTISLKCSIASFFALRFEMLQRSNGDVLSEFTLSRFSKMCNPFAYLKHFFLLIYT